ncbi:MAG: 50S ribosomal protein L11 methyltransferase [Haliangium ochraceum]
MKDRRTSWLEIQIEIDAGAAETVAAVAGEIADGIELRDAGTLIHTNPNRALVIAHVAPEDRAELLAAVDEAAVWTRDAGLPIDPVIIRERDAHEDEWRDVWKQYFRATRVGRSFIIRPSWDPGSVASGDRVIDLDPGRAFGTGGHASTRLVITLMEDLADESPNGTGGGLPRTPRFLDLGCGSGILAIAAARLWPASAGLAVDIDEEATACARENFDRNAVASVALVTGSLDALPPEGQFDVVLANIQADVLCGLAAKLPARMARGGRAILSGLLLRDADPVLGAFQTAGFELGLRRDDGEWAALSLRLSPAPPKTSPAGPT